MKAWLLTSVFALMPGLAQAQSIVTGELDAAQAFDAGVIDARSGGLDAALWQGTSAKTAVRLMQELPLSSEKAIVQDMIEAVILSAGVPPEGDRSNYDRVRLQTVMAMGDKAALENIAARNPEITRDPTVRTDLALAGGDVTEACQTADNITQGRGEPYWAKLRAFCHIVRDELSAAELTTELLKNSGHEDEAYFELMKVLTGVSKTPPMIESTASPLLKIMAKRAAPDDGSLSAQTAMDAAAKPEDRVKAIFEFADSLSDAQMTSAFSDLSFDEDELAGGAGFDLDSAKANIGPKGTAQIFQLATSSGDARTAVEAMALILTAADKKGVFSRFAKLFENNMAIIPVSLQAEADVKIFTRAAIERGDVGALQGFYQALPEGQQKLRIALVADALGNGFTLGSLGEDIETRLAAEGTEKRRAIRDTFIATAMGSRLTGEAEAALSGVGSGTGISIKAGELLALDAAAKAGSRAETALRAASMIDRGTLDDASLAAVISALQIAGLPQFAGRLAAEDFMSGL
ncbi:hypothetical protein [Hellea balneolensis]|uniref:hypothetical protein n=1 Tax=Hellea balneolensis TaxID=287478 RepID=UPI00040B91A0|nr:hypothetical protein [Hellea balneolensis]